MKKLLLLFILLSALNYRALAQNEHLYEETYDVLNEMLVDSTKYNFKKAVFSVEQTYYYGDFDTEYLDALIDSLATLSKGIIKTRQLSEYKHKDKDLVLKYSSLYTVMRDSIQVKIRNEDYEYYPFNYDFEDIWGEKEWSNMFVSKLLYTRKGNCHSLPYLYKILAEEIGVDAHLALAPNHIYIKHKKFRWI